MDNDTPPFYVPLSVAVRLDDLDDAVQANIITQQQAQALWSRWVVAPARLTESTVPMPLGGAPDAPGRWLGRVAAVLARVPVVGPRLQRWLVGGR